MLNLNEIYKKAENRERLTTEEALNLAQNGDFLKLGELANSRSKALHGKRVSYLIDRNINYTNVCKAICRFCAFYRPKGHKEAYVLTYEQISQKIIEALEAGATQILMQGGIHPDLKIDYYIELVSYIKKNHPEIAIHSFSPPELHYIAEISKLSLKDTMQKLKDAGLQSVPGGGGEILVDRVRERLTINKCSTQEWLDVMIASHSVGVKTTSTMMMGHVETWAERIEHLQRLRDVQDQTGGFISFIPWTFQADNTALNPKLKKNNDVNLATPHEYLRLLAVARLFLDNIDHIQASNLTVGQKVGQMALYYGANDMGSIMLEENVVSSAGCDGAVKLNDEEIIRSILESDHQPYQRNTFYDEVNPERTQKIIDSVQSLNRYHKASSCQNILLMQVWLIIKRFYHPFVLR